MNILTDSEIADICCTVAQSTTCDIAYARAIEAAMLKKLAALDIEPVAWNYELEDAPFKRLIELGVSSDSPLYTESQIAAAQLKTAEACAKLIEALRQQDGDGDWREYL